VGSIQNKHNEETVLIFRTTTLIKTVSLLPQLRSSELLSRIALIIHMCVIPHSRNNKSRIAVREGDFCRCLWGFRCSFLPHTSTQTVLNYWEKEDLNCLRWITFNISSVSKYPLRTQLIFTLHTESIRSKGVEDPLESVQREWSNGFFVTGYVGSRTKGPPAGPAPRK